MITASSYFHGSPFVLSFEYVHPPSYSTGVPDFNKMETKKQWRLTTIVVFALFCFLPVFSSNLHFHEHSDSEYSTSSDNIDVTTQESKIQTQRAHFSKVEYKNNDNISVAHDEVYKNQTESDHDGIMNHNTHSHIHEQHKMSTVHELLLDQAPAAKLGYTKDAAENKEHEEHDGTYFEHAHGKDHDMTNKNHHMTMSNHSEMHGMMMFFHTGINEVVLFKDWKISTLGGMIASVIGIILLAMFYECLKYFREYLFKQYISSMQFSTVAVTGESGRATQVHKVERQHMMSWAHTMQTGLHIVQIVLSYFLMLIFMTYNVWLCIAVVVGSAIGYFIFGWKKATVVDITEHCH